METFDLAGPLARGITLIEASAGTGKTYSIAGLFARLIAEEGLLVERIAVVTFTEAATFELKGRLRERLVDEARRLREEGPEGDETTLRIQRLEAASQGFDRAAISTIHGLCQRMLALYAFECGAELDRELVAEQRAIYQEVADDFRSQLLHDASVELVRFLGAETDISPTSLIGLAAAVVSNPDAPLYPGEDADIVAEHAAFVAAATSLSAALAADGASLVSYLDEKIAQKTFPGSKVYTRNSPAKRLEKLRELVGRGSLSKLESEAAARYFSRDQLREHAHEGAELTHPLLAAFEDFQRLASGLQRSLHVPRLRFARYARAQVPARLAARGQMGFDDLVRSLARAVCDEQTGPALSAALRGRFDAVLLDEFQDTDSEQWTLFERAFGPSGRGAAPFLYLIGDPKQAIYSFRGADVNVYAAASQRAEASRRFTMKVNYRSDARLLAALNALFGARADLFGLDFVEYIPVSASSNHEADGLRFADGRAPVELRRFDGTTAGLSKTTLGKGEADELLPELVADDVVTYLDAGEILTEVEGRPVVPRDVAVLVRTNRQARAIQAALVGRGVPAIIDGPDSVFASEEARELELFLAALLSVDRDGPARAFALGRFGGLTAADLDDDDGERWTAMLANLGDMRRAYAVGGVLAALHLLYERVELYGRLAREPRGERALVNLRHLEELLHGAEARDGLGLASLLTHLRAMRADEGFDEERDRDAESLRLESDEDAVRIVTMHKSKGLEYRIVFAPYLWSGGALRDSDKNKMRFRGPDGRIAIDLFANKRDPAWEQRRAAAVRDVVQEDMRLAYVALTRARHALVLYFGPVSSSQGAYDSSPVATLLHGHAVVDDPRPLGQAARARVAAVLTKDATEESLAEVFEGDPAGLAASANGGGRRLIDVTHAAPPGRRGYARDRAALAPLALRTLTRPSFEMVAGRHSYSGMVADAVGRAHAELAPGLDEGDIDEVAVVDEEPTGQSPVPLSGLRAGAATGLFLHSLLEHLDFRDARAKGTGAPLAEFTRQLAADRGFSDPEGVEALIAALPDIFATPLGGPLGARSLSQLAPSDRIDELVFDMPVGGGSRADATTAVRDERFVAALADRPTGLRDGYRASLRAMRFPPLAGFLTGAIDLVFRAEVDGTPRYFVADYKSNRLADAGGLPSLPHHYDAAGLLGAMEEHHYFVQSHLYVVALHRFLASRLGDRYDYERDVGGAYYLFLRGMLGPEAPHGVFFDKPPYETVEAISNLLGPAGGFE